jgi:type I restriction enzyme S subunit
MAKVTMFKAESYAGYKLCWPGDLVINSLWAWAGGLGVSRHHGIVSSAYGVYRLRRDAGVMADFIHELVRSIPFNWELQVRSKGIWTSRLQLTDEAFLDAPFVLPPPDEQAAIVRFLDHMSGHIESAVRSKRKLIALLNEQKQAIIHRAVTRGIDPAVPLKPSGVPWLGEIPCHWQLTRLKHITPQVTVGIVIQPARLYVPAGVPCLRSLNISGGSISPDNLVFISRNSHRNHSKSRLHKGDLVVVRTGRTGVAAIVTDEFDGANCIDLLIVRKSDRLLSEFLLTYLRSYGAQSDIAFNSVGAIQAHYNTETLGNLRIPLPGIVEQQSILRSLETELKPTNATIDRVRREIELLREFHARVSSDIVIGKLDIREVVAGLPDERSGETDVLAEPEIPDEFELAEEEVAA